MTLRSRVVDGVFGVLELVVSLYELAMKLRRPRPSLDVTEPIPLRRPRIAPKPPRVPRI